MHQALGVRKASNLCSQCREAQLEKKAARREAAKEREQSPDISKLPGGGDIMGGGDSFAAAKARYGAMRMVPETCCCKRDPGVVFSILTVSLQGSFAAFGPVHVVW